MTKSQAMNNRPASIYGRTALGALFTIVSFTFVVLVVLPTNSQSGQRRATKNQQSTGPAAAVAAATPAPQDPGPPIGYENFAAPGVLVPVTTTEAGQQVHSVEWMGRNAGEPTIGSNRASGVTIFQTRIIC